MRKKTESLSNSFGNGRVLGYSCDVLDIEGLKKVKQDILNKWNRIDALVNCAGGNVVGATLTQHQSFFDLNLDLWNDVLNLNLNGSIYPSYVFGEVKTSHIYRAH